MSSAKVPDKEKRVDANLQTPPNESRSCKDNSNPAKLKNSNIVTATSKTTVPIARKSPKTPIKTPAKKYGTPNSLPPRPRPERGRAEPSFLEEFLLGRSSLNRVRYVAPARRASLEAVKADMKSEYVAKLKGPSKVKDRVKQWQKSTAMSESLNDIDLGVGSIISESARETRADESFNIKPQVAKRLSEKSSRESGESNLPRKSSTIPRQERAAPKKHVRHDSHWMKHDVKISPPTENNPTKNHLTSVASNLPLEKKIQDWIKRSDMDGETAWVRLASKEVGTTDADHNNTSHTKRTSLPNMGSPCHIKPSSYIQQQTDSSGQKSPTIIDSTDSNDGIQVKPYCNHTKQSRRVKNVGNVSIHNGTQRISKPDKYINGAEKVISKKTSLISEQESGPIKNQTKSNSSGLKQAPPIKPTLRKPLRNHMSCHQVGSRMKNLHALNNNKQNKKRPLSTSPNQRSRNPIHRSVARSVSLSDVPFGNSAFSALDLPLGAEANTLKKTSSKRNSSFIVPNVLKMVYSGGKKITLDNAEPPKGGLSQPTSVESWLKTTGDPFVDTPTPPEITLRDSVCTNEKSNVMSESNITMMEQEQEQDNHSTKSLIQQKNMRNSSRPFNSPETFPSKGGSPVSLKRAPARRRKSSSKTSRAIPLKESIITAFHGESVMKKPKSPSPYDFIGLKVREGDKSESLYHNISTSGSNSNKDYYKSHDLKMPRKSSKKYNRDDLGSDDNNDENKVEDDVNYRDGDEDERSNKLSRWSATQNYTHNLSTILSESASITNSSKSQLNSEYHDSNATDTQETLHTIPSGSTLSAISHKNSLKKRELKTRLTKHSDLISILSLSNTTEPGNPGNIRPARSIRTYRKSNRTASTVDNVLVLLAEEETQYMQELDTLIDGVVPVLLKCISNSNVSGLFYSLEDHITFLTQSIIDMGNSLVSLRTHHKCIPLADAYALLIWASSAKAAYEDYLRTWRSGFEDIVVNLTPMASRPSSTAIHEIKRDQNGDLLGERGEKIVVADLLRKPIIRIKHINKALKSLNNFPQTKEEAKQICTSYDALMELRALRIKEENARSIDQQAWSVDASRARYLWNLERTNHLEINKNFQVIAKDCFSLEILHSTGQRINCGVELVMRNLPGLDSEGDLLILKDDIKDPFLLFDPLLKKDLSARLGDTREQVVVMIRDSSLKYLHAEFLILDAQDESIAEDWIKILGEQPIPPPISRTRLKINPALESVISSRDADTASVMQILKDVETDKVTPPIGERASEEEYARPSLTQGSRREYYNSSQFSKIADEPQGYMYEDDNARMMTTTDNYTFKRKKFSTGQGHQHDLAQKDKHATEVQDLQEWKSFSRRGDWNLDQLTESQMQEETHKETSRKKTLENRVESSETLTSLCEDSAPPPPAHKTPVAGILNTVPILESLLPRGITRRISSPLKHEYRPSLTSDGSSEATSDGDSSSSISFENKTICESDEDISKEDENEEKEEGEERQSNYGSDYEAHSGISSFIKTSGNRAALPLDLQDPVENLQEKFIAVLSQWNPKTGKWLSLYSQACLVLITDGLIECFEHDPSPFSPQGVDSMKCGKALFKQILTPVVQVRQSTAIDIEINSAIIAGEEAYSSSSLISQRSDTLRYRLFGPSACDDFYAAVHQSRLREKEYLKLGEESRIRDFEGHSFDQDMGSSGRRRHLFKLGRRRSYRASTRARLENHGSGASKSTSTALIAIQRFTGTGFFNISRSWAENSRWRGYHHRSSSKDLSTHTGSSSYSGGGGLNTPPHSPSSQAGNSDSIYSSGLTVRNLGTTNILFRLYYMLRSGNWDDHGQAFLSVSLPPPDMKQKAPLYNGPQKRITITRSPIPVIEVVTSADVRKAGLLLDEVLGANLFVRMQKSGILLQTWEDVVSSEEDREGNGNGNNNDNFSGAVRKFGSVAPRRHIWAMQFRRAGDAEWCWQLCRSGMP